MRDLVAHFLGSDALDNLESWEEACFKLLNEPTGEWMDQLYRSAHNLKGTSKGVGLTKLADFIHVVEEFIQSLRSTPSLVDEKAIDTLFATHEHLCAWVERLKDDREVEPDNQGVMARIPKHIIEKAHANKPNDDGEIELLFDLPPIEAHAATSKGKPEVPASAPEMLANEAGPVAKRSSEVGEDSQAKAEDKGGRRAESNAKDETMRIEVSYIDSFIKDINELSIQFALMKHCLETGTVEGEGFRNSFAMSMRALKDVQSTLMEIRMVPIEGLFKRLVRIVSGLSKELGKNVEIHLDGLDVKADRNILDKLKDPLAHMVRNAVDHGIESPEERKLAGKSKLANLRIKAFSDTRSIFIILQDDGGGMDVEVIYEKAKQKGFVTRPRQSFTDDQLLQLICTPGFSTRAQVTDISGRGVGMDVVKKVVEEVRGDIAISSQVGKGTRFTIQIPTNFSIVEAFVVDINKTHYAVPIMDIDEIVSFSELVFENSSRGRFVKMRNQVVPVDSLGELLERNRGNFNDDDERLSTVLVVKGDDSRVAFLCNRVIQTQQIVIKPLRQSLKAAQLYSGETILNNGQPSLILDMKKILKLSLFNNERGQAA